MRVAIDPDDAYYAECAARQTAMLIEARVRTSDDQRSLDNAAKWHGVADRISAARRALGYDDAEIAQLNTEVAAQTDRLAVGAF